MEEDKSVQEQTTSKLQKVKGEIEHLELQLALGKAEAADKFDEKKKELHDTVNKAKEELGKVTGKGKELASQITPELEHLQVQLALGKAESLDSYHELEKNAKDAMHQISLKSDKLMELGEEKYEALGNLMKQKVGEFKNQMEIYKLQLTLGEADAKDELEEKKKLFLREAQVIGKSIQEKLDDAEDALEDIGDKIADEFKALKKKFFD